MSDAFFVEIDWGIVQENSGLATDMLHFRQTGGARKKEQ
jgi:hypothetical protein